MIAFVASSVGGFGCGHSHSRSVLRWMDVLPWMGGTGGFFGEPSPPCSSLPGGDGSPGPTSDRAVGWDTSVGLDRTVVLDMSLK